VVSRITSDTQEFGQMVVLVTDLIAQIVQVVFLGAILLVIDWRLTLILVAVCRWFRRCMASGLARQVTRQMRAMANVNATIKESVSGISVAKNFRQEAGIFDEFDQANRQSYRVNVRRGLVLSLVFPVLNAVSGVAMAVMVYAGGMSVAAGIVTAGSLSIHQSLIAFSSGAQPVGLISAEGSYRSGVCFDRCRAQVVQVDHDRPET
jgi:ATP-binding cassette subfamily B protein